MGDRVYRDSRGKRLDEYPRPSVAVDTAVLTVVDGELAVLQVERPKPGEWALPGTFLWPGETLADAVTRSLKDKANVDGLRPQQLHVFDDPTRDDRGWVLSVAHVDVVQHQRLSTRPRDTTRLMPVDAPGRLPYDHPKIIHRARDHLRNRYAARPDPDGLLGDEFTMLQLRQVHEAIAGHPLQPDTFRRLMDDHLDGTGVFVGGRGRPAELFRRKGEP